MTIAELHGKISRTGANLHNQMEDLLTSDLFSTCKYVRPSTLLLPYLQTSVDLNGASICNYLSEDILNVEYRFWPMLERSEPDLLLCFHDQGGKPSLVMVEAKYLSAKSSVPLEREELDLALVPSDQLAREYLDIMDSHRYFGLQPSDIKFCCLVYLTAHRIIPKGALRESLDEISHFTSTSDINLFWTSWFKLYPLLEEKPDWLDWEKPIIKDLKLLLERKRLIMFPGFRPLKSLKLVRETPLYVRKGYFEDVLPIHSVHGLYQRRES